MRFRYSTADAAQGEADALPRIPLVLRGEQAVEVVGLVDSGATVSVLPYEVGIRLGATWDDRKANIRLAGTFGTPNLRYPRLRRQKLPACLRSSWHLHGSGRTTSR